MSRARTLTRSRFLWTMAISISCFLTSLVLSALVGETPLNWQKVFLGHEPDSYIFWNFRLPRIVLAALVGGALAVVGVAFQALLRNPLADPFLLGVSGGAALGGSLWYVLGFSALWSFSLTPLAAFGGALGTTVLVYRLAMHRGRMFTLNLLLIGVMVNFFASAVIMFIKTIIRPEKAQALLMWLMGSLAFEGLGLTEIGVVALFVVLGSMFLFSQANGLNALLLGEESARSVGVATERVKRVVFFAASLMIGGAVALTGMIGFVGLVVPHIMRLVCGPDHRVLLPVSAFAGATFLVLADMLIRLLFRVAQHEFPVGVLTAFIGGPLFIYLLRRHRRESFF